MDDYLAGDSFGDFEEADLLNLTEEEATPRDDRDEDGFFEPLAGAPKRLSTIAFCERCGCRLSQYRNPEDKLCCACNRAVNPLFDKSA